MEQLAPVLIALIVGVQTVVVAYFGFKIKKSATATEESVEKVHVAVNSEREAMTNEIRSLHKTILDMTKADKK